jgi:hypothetical protein
VSSKVTRTADGPTLRTAPSAGSERISVAWASAVDGATRPARTDRPTTQLILIPGTNRARAPRARRGHVRRSVDADGFSPVCELELARDRVEITLDFREFPASIALDVSEGRESSKLSREKSADTRLAAHEPGVAPFPEDRQ